MLRVTADCSVSTPLIIVCVSLMRSTTSRIEFSAVTTACTSDWITATRAPTSSVARAVSRASSFNVTSHDREALACLAGASGLDRGVKCEQIGLRGDARDGLHDLADGFTGGAEARDLLVGLGGQFVALQVHSRHRTVVYSPIQKLRCAQLLLVQPRP